VIAVAIDIGGTFTDLVGFDDKTGHFADAKSLTTPTIWCRALSTV